MTGENGDRLNRQIKASEAYANLTRDVKDVRDVVGEIRDDLKDLKRNPMVKLGLAFGTAKRAAAAVIAFAATCVGIGAGVVEILRHRT